MFIRVIPLFAVLLLVSSCGQSGEMVRNNPRNIRGVVSYRRSFGDLNDCQLKAAKKIGITPMQTRSEVEQWRGLLVGISPCPAYDIDSLTHSVPYLVPQAVALLETIGENFQDSLLQKGLNPNKIIVTSVTRTIEDVKRLRRTNINSSLKSCHFYGTTFDISWKRFRKMEDPEGRPLEDVRWETLKLVLSEVLRDLRKAEYCFIKYELKQGCFHITAR